MAGTMSSSIDANTTVKATAPVVPTTTQGMLDTINAAIYAIAVSGQEYKIGSRQLRRGDLKQLYGMRNDLMAQVQAETATGFFDDCYVAVFDRR